MLGPAERSLGINMQSLVRFQTQSESFLEGP